VVRPGLKEFAEAEMAKFGGEGHRDKLPMSFRGDTVAVSADAAALERVGGGFARNPLHARIAEVYRDGAGLVLGVDLERMSPFGRQPGLTNVKYLVLEQKDLLNKSDTRALVSFAGPRKGVTSWLAAPAAMGALEFVSPEATFASAFVVKSPSAVLDDVFGMVPASDLKFRQNVAEAEAKLGVSLRGDLAASLGGEFALAVDGPALPTPSWTRSSASRKRSSS
jgi:hypothetical protein